MTEEQLQKHQLRIVKGIQEKLGDDANFEEEFERILKGESKLSFRERQFVVIVVARQKYLKQQADDSVEGEVE